MRADKNSLPPDLGFGTRYEKFIFQEIAKKLAADFKIKRVAEYPANSLLGDNREIFNKCCPVVDQISCFQKNLPKYDLVWNFCKFERQKNPYPLLEKMSFLSNKYLLLVVQNKTNPGVFLHKIFHLLVRRKWDHGFLRKMSAKPVSQACRAKKLKILKVGAFDVPWFILDVYESGKLLRKFLPGLFTKQKKMKKSRFEQWPFWIKKWLAHHFYILAEK